MLRQGEVAEACSPRARLEAVQTEHALRQQREAPQEQQRLESRLETLSQLTSSHRADGGLPLPDSHYAAEVRLTELYHAEPYKTAQTE